MKRDLGVAALAMFIWALGEGLFFYLVPLYMESLGANGGLIGTAIALLSLAQAVVMLPAGMAADRWGPRRVMIGGWLMGLLTTAVMAAATSFQLFAVGLVAYGFSGWIVPALTSYVTRSRGDLTPERALTLVFAGFSAGSIISPALGGLLAERFGMRATFVVAVAVFAVSTLVICSSRHHPPAGNGSRSGIKRLSADRRYLQFLAMVVVVTFALLLGSPLAPNFLQARWGVAVADVGMLGSAAALGEVLLALLLGFRPPRRALFVLLAAGLAYLAIILTRGGVAWLALAFFLRAGGQISRQFFDALVTRIVPIELQGMAFAGNATAGRLASMAAAGAAGWLYVARPALPFQVGLFLIPIAAFFVYRFAPRPAAYRDSDSSEKEPIPVN